MNAGRSHDAVSRLAAAIGEPARARMLFALMDGRGRTSTELAIIAGVMPSTASVHLSRLKAEQLVTVHPQGRHRYYTLNGPDVATALEALRVVAGSPDRLVVQTPKSLRAARTCYDHIAGTLGVALHDRFAALRWIAADGSADGRGYDVTAAGAEAFALRGIDIDATRAQRRRFAFACIDWSERRPHLAGALAAAFLRTALNRKWLCQESESRVLTVTAAGRREIFTRLALDLTL